MRRTWIFSALFLLLGSTAAWAAANRAPAGWGTTAKRHRHVRVVRDRAVKIRKHRLHSARTSSTSKTGVSAQLAGDPILFGDSTVESTRDTTGAGVGEAFAFANTTAGTSASISVYVGSNNTASKLYAGVYTDNHEHPGSLVASGSLSYPKSGAWNNVSVPSAMLHAGRTYWVAVLGTGGTLRFRDRSGGTCVSEISSQTKLGSLPSTWKVGTQYGECPVSAYVNGYLLAAPSNTGLPVISGTAIQGETLTTDDGAWAGSPTGYAYQWRQCDSAGNNCANISGATSGTYTLTRRDLVHTVRAVVTASNPGGSGTVTSSATGAVAEIPPTAAFTSSPASPVTGQAVHLDASASSCTNGPCTYTWVDDGPDGPGGADWALGSGQTLDFTFQQAAAKHVRVTVTDALGGNATVEHDVVVGQAPQAPANTALPAVSGTAQQSQILTTSNGSWSNSPASYSFKWQDCDSSGNACADITGATSNSYLLTSGDIGHTVRAVVTATNATGSVSATSAVTSVVAAAPSPPANQTLPALSGTATQGQSLTTSNGTWTGTPSYTYQWRSCDNAGNSCSDIAGATSSSYELTNGDVGHTVRTVVTASNGTGATSATSAASAVVAAAPPPPSPPSNTALPAVSGGTVQGQTLTTSDGSWTGSPTSYSYGWQDCDASGNDCSPIGGAPSSTYTLTAGDVGHAIRAVVTGMNASGSTNATSVATAPVTTSSSCTMTLSSGANLVTAVSNVPNGGTVCLNAGSYSWNVAATKSAMTTVTTAPGVSRSQVTLTNVSLQYSTNVKLLGLTLAGGDLYNSARHIRLQNDDITANLHISDGPSMDILIDGNTFEPVNTCSGSTYEGHIEITGGSGNSTVNGVVISNNTILGGNGDGIQNGGYGTQIGPGNDISGQIQSGVCHADGIQLYGSSHTLIEDNYFHNNTDGIMACGTTSSVDINSETIRGNVISTKGYDAICFGSNAGTSVIDHNTLQQSGGPGAIRMCSQPSCYGTSNGTTISNNVGYGWYVQNGDSAVGVTSFNNLFSNGNAGTNGIAGTPTFAGGSSPATCSGFKLTSGSLGTGKASDGSNIGADYSN